MATPRAVLFVPGDRPERIVKALSSPADAVIVDLEDAVAQSAKDRGRTGAVEGITAASGHILPFGVRVNALDTGLLTTDVEALAPVWGRIAFIMVPMVPDAATVREVAVITARASDRYGAGQVGIVPLIETARGVLAAAEIAAADPAVLTVAFGPADLSCELGVTPSADGSELLHARSQLVLAAAAAGCPPPIDGPWLDIDDLDGLQRSAATARALGFGGKQVIHPAQIATVTQAFSVTDEELSWARAVDAAFTEAESRGVSSIRLADGTFVDYPVARRARALLDRDWPPAAAE